MQRLAAMAAGFPRLSRLREAASRPYVWPIAIVGLSLLYYASFYRHFLNLADEGFLVNGALRVLQGQVPISDFYAYPPGRYYLLAALFAVFGTTVATERLMWVVLMSVRNLLVFTVSRRLLHPSLSLAVALTVMLVPGGWHKTLLSLLMFAHLEILFRYVARPSPRLAVAAGLMAGLFAYFRQDYPVFGVVACLIAILAARVLAEPFSSIKSRSGPSGTVSAAAKDIGLALVSCVLLAVPLVVFYAGRGEWSIVARRMGLGGLATASLTFEAFSLPPVPTLLRLVSRLPHHWPHTLNMWFANAWFGYLTLLALVSSAVLVAYRLWKWARDRDSDARPTAFLLVLLVWTALTAVRAVQLPLFVYFLTVSQGIVVLWACLLAALFEWARHRAGAADNRRSTGQRVALRASRLLLVLLVGGVLTFSWLTLLLYGLKCDECGTIAVRQYDAAPLRLARADLLLDPEQASELSALVDEVQSRTSMDDGIFAFRRPMLYFLAERPNATSMDWPDSPATNPQDAAELAAELRHRSPSLEIVHADSWLARIISGYPCDLQHALFDDYDIVVRIGKYLVLERSPGANGWGQLQEEFQARELGLTAAPGCEF